MARRPMGVTFKLTCQLSNQEPSVGLYPLDVHAYMCDKEELPGFTPLTVLERQSSESKAQLIPEIINHLSEMTRSCHEVAQTPATHKE